MTPSFFRVKDSYLKRNLISAYKYVRQSKFINDKEAKKKNKIQDQRRAVWINFGDHF